MSLFLYLITLLTPRITIISLINPYFPLVRCGIGIRQANLHSPHNDPNEASAEAGVSLPLRMLCYCFEPKETHDYTDLQLSPIPHSNKNPRFWRENSTQNNLSKPNNPEMNIPAKSADNSSLSGAPVSTRTSVSGSGHGSVDDRNKAGEAGSGGDKRGGRRKRKGMSRQTDLVVFPSQVKRETHTHSLYICIYMEIRFMCKRY